MKTFSIFQVDASKPSPTSVGDTCLALDTGKFYKSTNGTTWSGGGDATVVDATAATASLRSLGSAATQACPGNDARLSDARPPTTLLSSGSGGVGYATGAGGTVTQLTSKATGVTLNKLCGQITMHNAALAAGAIVTFTVTNSQHAAGDVVHVQHDSGGTVGPYLVTPNTSAAGSFKITVRNTSAGSLAEAIVLRFAIVKAVAA